MIVLGVDPGLTGAFAFLDHHGQIIAVEDMWTIEIREAGPNTTVKREIDVLSMWEAVRDRVKADDAALAFMEHTSSVGAVQGEQAKLSLAASKASCMAVMTLAKLDVHRVTPRSWKAFYGIKEPVKGVVGPDGKKLPDGKKQALALARKFWPGCQAFAREKDHNRAEAALIARFGQRHFT
jgi:hypothetical protein